MPEEDADDDQVRLVDDHVGDVAEHEPAGLTRRAAQPVPLDESWREAYAWHELADQPPPHEVQPQRGRGAGDRGADQAVAEDDRDAASTGREDRHADVADRQPVEALVGRQDPAEGVERDRDGQGHREDREGDDRVVWRARRGR